jgi:mannonate dehydratase
MQPRARVRPLLAVLPAAFFFVLAGAGCSLIYDAVGGAYRGEPRDLMSSISPGARELVRESLEPLEGRWVADYHVHLFSRRVHPGWFSCWHPIRYARTMVYLSAAGIEWTADLVEDYVERLRELARHIPLRLKLYLYAMDRYYLPDGTARPELTPMYVPNELVVSVARRHPELFVPVISVHPYRRDAIEELDKWARRGCRHVKWLPNSMGIDPSCERVEPFYSKMVELDMVLLTHTGDEHALEYPGGQELGNPLLLRKPLDMGVRVVALHAAGNGTHIDLDSAGGRRCPGSVLLLRLLDDPEYEGLLYADTSCLAFFNHLPEPLETLLRRRDLQRRLVHGSDYPFSAVNVAICTSQLAGEGFITAEEREYLEEIYAYNPLLFVLVLHRVLRHPETGDRFLETVFEVPGPLR